MNDYKSMIREMIALNFPMPDKKLSHLECLEMRAELPMIESSSLPSILGQVMEDALDTHTGDVCNTEDLDFVVYFLDILRSSSESLNANELSRVEEAIDICLMQHPFEGYDIEQLRLIFKEIALGVDEPRRDLNAIACISTGQAHAIFHWLIWALKLPEMQVCRNNLLSALLFWQNWKIFELRGHST